MRDSNPTYRDGTKLQREKRPKSERFTSVDQNWLGMRFEERKLYNQEPSEANIERLKDLLEN